MLDQYTSADSAPYQEWRSPEVTPTQNPQSPTQLNSLSHNNNSRVVNQPKQPEFQRGQSRTIYLPAERTGAVIGKNGRMKHLIKEVCNVWMSIKSEPFELDNTKRVCVIRGPTTDNLDHAESLINELLRDRETIEKSIALNTSDDVGRVIGSGGSNIQVIKDKTGAFVYVDKENVPTQYAGRCIIRGNSVQVQAAEKRVLELLARRDLNILEQCIAAHTNASFAKQMSAQPKMNPSTSPTQHQMMSHSYDRFQTSDKNGFGMFNSSANSHGYHGMNENDQKTSIDQSQNGTQILQWNNPQTDQWATQKENEKEMEKHAKKRIQDTILIPLQAVGMVIGKKGKNIKIIQETSGANVYIDKEYTGHDDNALCVIHGKMEQVDIAKEMIHEKLQQYNSANTFPIDNFGTQLDSPPSDTRSDGSTGIQGSAYSSPPTHGSSNSYSPPNPYPHNFPTSPPNSASRIQNSFFGNMEPRMTPQMMSKMYQAQPAIPSPHDLPQPVSRYQPPPVSQQMPLPREREISGRSNSSSYDRFSLGLDHLKHLNLGPSERPGAQMTQNGASSPYYESAHGGDTQRDIFFNQNLPPKSAIGSWTN